MPGGDKLRGRERGARPARAPFVSAAAFAAGAILAAGAWSSPYCPPGHSCPLPPTVGFAGALTVAAPGGAGDLPAEYGFSPDTARAGQAFTLRLTGRSFDCATAFGSVQAAVSGGSIVLSFIPETLPKGCADTSHAYGPSFAIPALAAGSYAVRIDRLDRDALAEAGVLAVIEPIAIRSSDPRAAAPRMRGAGGMARFALPEGKPGAWQAEWVDLEGRILGSARVIGSPGDRVSVPAPRFPARAPSLMRLTPPSGDRVYLDPAR